MTLIDLGFADLMRCCFKQALVVSWSATRTRFDGARHHLERHSLVLRFEMLSPESGMLEAWSESEEGAHTVYPQQLVRLACLVEGGFVHLDANQKHAADVPALAHLTFRAKSNDETLELVFGQTSLLRKAGFVAGAYDPPSLREIANDQIAASA